MKINPVYRDLIRNGLVDRREGRNIFLKEHVGQNEFLMALSEDLLGKYRTIETSSAYMGGYLLLMRDFSLVDREKGIVDFIFQTEGLNDGSHKIIALEPTNKDYGDIKKTTEDFHFQSINSSF